MIVVVRVLRFRRCLRYATPAPPELQERAAALSAKDGHPAMPAGVARARGGVADALGAGDGARPGAGGALGAARRRRAGFAAGARAGPPPPPRPLGAVAGGRWRRRRTGGTRPAGGPGGPCARPKSSAATPGCSGRGPAASRPTPPPYSKHSTFCPPVRARIHPSARADRHDRPTRYRSRAAVPALASGMGQFHQLKRRFVMLRQGDVPRA